MSVLRIIAVPCLEDNYAYLLADDARGCAAVIDPSEPGPVTAALEREKLVLTHILNTHHHPDHTGGNLALKERFGAIVAGPAHDRARIPGLDTGLGETTPWAFGPWPLGILAVPGHTLGAIAFVLDGAVFTGDTLFVLGCGRLFEGTPAMMVASLAKLMALPDETRVYCGHEYAAANARFALTLEPGNRALRARAREIEAASAAGRPNVPSTIGLEKRANPFLRWDSPEIRARLGLADAGDAAVFAETRRRKDLF